MPPPASARISTCCRSRAGNWASAGRMTSMWSAAVFDPAVAGAEHNRQRLPAAVGAVVGERGQRPNVFFQVGARSPCPSTRSPAWRPSRRSPGRRRRPVPLARSVPRPAPGRRPRRPDRFQRPVRIGGQRSDRPRHHRIPVLTAHGDVHLKRVCLFTPCSRSRRTQGRGRESGGGRSACQGRLRFPSSRCRASAPVFARRRSMRRARQARR